MSELKSKIKEILKYAIENKDVYLLCKYYFKTDLTDGQSEIVRSIAFKESKKIVISAYTRYGKSWAVAQGVLLYIKFNPNKKVRLIAPTGDQTSILRNYISNFILQSKEFISLLPLETKKEERLRYEANQSRIVFKNGAELKVLSAHGKAERLMGWGGDLIVLDESCLIPYEVYRQKISRMLGDYGDSMLVEIGNPWHKENQMYEHWLDPNFKKIHIDYRQGFKEGRITPEFIEEQRRLLTDIEFTILYEAEFPEDEEDSLFKNSEIKNAINNTKINNVKELRQLVKEKRELEEKQFLTSKEQARLKDIVKQLREFEYIISCDVADKGIDESVVFYGVKKGNTYEVEGYYSEKVSDNMKLAGKILNIWKEKAPKEVSSKIIIDGIGVGVGVVSRLNEVIREQNLKTRVVSAHFGSSAIKNDKYLNKKAENYMRLKALFEEKLIKFPDIKPLYRNLLLMKFEVNSAGKIRIIDPEKSPDYADALVFFIWQDKESLAFSFV